MPSPLPDQAHPPKRTDAGRSLRAGALLVAALGVVAGCATPSSGQRSPLNRWTQLGPDGIVSLRAIVAGDDGCPTAIVDGQALPLLPRAQAAPAAQPDTQARANPAFRPEFQVTSCELTLPAAARQASIDGQAIALPRSSPQRIVVVGDTGCRIKVTASASSPPIQDCASPGAWPWPRLAAAAARTHPDLVIHVGDYHYREYCNDPAQCAPVRDQGVVVGYGWRGWNADFFTPAAPLLKAAPWIMVRGNHENCDRAGDGWMRFLSPLPYQVCGDQLYGSDSRSVLANNLTADAYRIDLDRELTLIIADNAGAEDYLPATARPDDVPLFKRQLRALQSLPASQRAWLFTHRPLWYDLLSAPSQPNALQVALREEPPANLQMVFSGHEHAFQALNFSPAADPAYRPAGRPAQLIVGGGGTELEASDPQSPLYEGTSGVGSKERASPQGQLYDGVAASSGIVLNRYSFLVLERGGEGWSGTLLDPDGRTISRCHLTGERKEVACSFPGR